MRHPIKIATVLSLAVSCAALAYPAMAAADSKPIWCGTSSNPARCHNAQLDFDRKLASRFSKAWNKAKPKLEAGPWEVKFQGAVQCMAYFGYRGKYRFLDASVNRSQDRNDTAKLIHTTSWTRKWHKCSLSGMSPQTERGTLQSNEPCDALPMQARYNLAIWMGGGVGYPHYSRLIAWQFTESGLFAVAGMKPVAFARCGYEHKTITCSDSTGDSFTYRY